MERLTQTSDRGGVAFTFDLDITCEPSEIKKILKLAEKLKDYEDLGYTPEECRAAMEKQKAKKPMHVTNSYFGYQKHKEHVGYCPDCGHQVEEPYGCSNCLRKIDWGDEE